MVKHNLDTSIFDKLQASASAIAETASTEIAAENVLRQNMMEKSGELQKVCFIGPAGLIPGFYSPAERAFLPEFCIEE